MKTRLTLSLLLIMGCITNASAYVYVAADAMVDKCPYRTGFSINCNGYTSKPNVPVDNCLIQGSELPDGLGSYSWWLCYNDSLPNANKANNMCDFSVYSNPYWVLYEKYSASNIAITGLASTSTCSNCKDDTRWKIVRTGYVSKILRWCECGVCQSETDYSCAYGYYGTTLNGSTGCTRCPLIGGCGSETSTPGSNNAITACYIPEGDDVDDTYGTYSFDEDCYYKQ